MSKVKRMTAIAGITSSILLAVAPAAHADDPSWRSHWDDAHIAQESHSWLDSNYTEINYTHCDSNSDVSTHVLLWRKLDYQPDPTFGSKRFTQCFSGSNGDWTSTGTYSGLDAGAYYFSVQYIDDHFYSDSTLDVTTVYVDTTKAD
ncbi:hypothetical protein AB0D30_41485 [Streptomyces sp. NPDC048409]|uniref:hypothetical protein n=1 Tax=Streptomyces sp. NPDC048409 TaxID=3154723 RepID=UPI00342F349A